MWHKLWACENAQIFFWSTEFEYSNLLLSIIGIFAMDNPLGPLLERRQLLNSAVTLMALGSHFVSLLVAAMSQEDGKANWNDSEILALVDFLWEHRAQAGDGGTFKNTMFNAAADKIAEHWTVGPSKTAKRCKTKWAGVSNHYLLVNQGLNLPQLKTTFRAIVTYKDTTSGTHWSSFNGAGIEGEAASSAWKYYINVSKVCFKIADFIVILLISSSQTRSWPHFRTRAFRISKKC